jgi:hypothetical protein
VAIVKLQGVLFYISLMARFKFHVCPYLITGHDMPFSGSEADAVQAQALPAIVSSNSPFSLFEDPEMLTLLSMLRSQAPGIIPTRRVLSGRLLDEASTIVHQKLSQILAGEALGLVYVNFLVQSPY